MSLWARALRRAVVATSGCLAAALLSGCTSGADPDPDPFRPTLVWGACPDGVEITFLSPHECGTLTVLADRADPAGGTIGLLVAKVPPPAGAVLPGVGTSFGHDVGDAEAISGAMASGAARMGRTFIQMEWRGSGPHTTTSLRCPEVDPLGGSAAGVPHDDPGLREAFVGAVAACATRLRSHGVEPGDYTTTAMAQDLEDLRVATDVDSWRVAGAYGTQSAVLFEYLRRHPGRVAAAYLDSPAFTSPAAFHGGAGALQDTLDTLFDTCEQSPTCRAAHPDLEGLWVRALDQTTASPLRGTVAVDGTEIAVLVDAAKLVRAVRFALGGERALMAALARIIGEAAAGRLAPELAWSVAIDPVFCSGYRPVCHDPAFSLGSFLTDFCSAAPLTGLEATEATRGRGSSHPAYAAVFDDSPYAAACDAWGVRPDRTQPTYTSVGIPLLLLSGSLDSFSPPAHTRTAASALGPQASVVEVPGGTHNVLGFSECAITARNEWTRHPEQPPPADACADALPVDFR